jgi:protocatechuate 3,4-dioxygenase beta subunit
MATDARLAEAIDRIGEALRTIVVDMDLSQQEWMDALAFLTDVGRADEFILFSDVLGLSVFVDERSHPSDDATTASNVQGPFYLPDAPLLEAPYRLAQDDEPGEPLVFAGRVSDADTGSPLAGALLEIWQADDAASYDVQIQDAEPHLRGRFPAGDDGGFELRTIVPPPYEIPKDGPVGRLLEALGRHAWRPAHLHLKVSHPGFEPLTTMVYFEGDPWLDSDTIGSVKEPLVVALERLPADDRCDRPHALCTFVVRLRRSAPSA